MTPYTKNGIVETDVAATSLVPRPALDPPREASERRLPDVSSGGAEPPPEVCDYLTHLRVADLTSDRERAG
jgi:hypothetical protein